MIGQYIVDFVNFEKKLVIEVDGGQHAEGRSDEVGDQWINGRGFQILRFWNDDVLRNRDGVLQKVIEHLYPPP